MFGYTARVNLSDEISRLAEEYDPEREADANATRAFIQGMLCMTMAQQKDPGPTRILKVIDVEQDIDANSDYLPYFTVVTEGGHRIRVTIEVE